jgi:hypothetical protein
MLDIQILDTVLYLHEGFCISLGILLLSSIIELNL